MGELQLTRPLISASFCAPHSSFEGRRNMEATLKTAVLFDIDGTWLRWQLFDEWIRLAIEYGILPQIVHEYVAEERRLYQTREAPFSQFVNALIDAYQREGRLKGVRVSDAQLVAKRVMEQKGKYVHVFTRGLAHAAQEAGMLCAVISGTFTPAVEAFAKANGIDVFYGTEHPHENGFFTGGKPIVWSDKKNEVVRKIALEHRVDLSASVAIGDSLSDVKMLKLVGYPICFNPERALLDLARAEQWPVVWEKKNVITYFQADVGYSELCERELKEILPLALADLMAQKLGQ